MKSKLLAIALCIAVIGTQAAQANQLRDTVQNHPLVKNHPFLKNHPLLQDQTLSTISEWAGAGVICLFGEKYGGGGSSDCAAPLKRVYEIERKTGGLVKKFSCDLTKLARIAYLSQAEGNTWPLKDIVNCHRK